MAADEVSEKGMALTEALADYFEIDPQEIQGYLIGIERVGEEGGLYFSTVWSTNKPMWQLLGFCDELKHHVEKQRPVEVPANGEVTPPRQVRRAAQRGGRRRKT